MEARLLHGLQQGHTGGNALPDLRGTAIQTGSLGTEHIASCHGYEGMTLITFPGGGDLLHPA